MIPSGSKSKWMSVLGIDDGSSSSDSQRAHPPDRRLRAASAPATATPHLHSSRRFPRGGISFHRTKNDDLLIRPLQPVGTEGESPPIYLVTLHQEPAANIATSKPDIVLHSSESHSSRVLSFAKFHSVTLSTEITICPVAPGGHAASGSVASVGSPPASTTFFKPGMVLGRDNSTRPRFRIVKLSPTGGMFTQDRHSFAHVLPGTSVYERFEWRSSSSGAFVRNLDGGGGGSEGSGSGMKLVRVRTNETVALYCTDPGGDGWRGEVGRVEGRLKFLDDDGGGCKLGGDLEILAVMSILSVVERARRVA